jgi:Trk K+ transport system NAD-binding subunit
MENHFILCGLGRVGRHVLDYLKKAGSPLVVIDNHADPKDPGLSGVHLIRGDCRTAEALVQAEVASARGVLILTSDDLVNLSAALQVHRLNPGVRVGVRVFNRNLIARLGPAAGNMVGLSTSALTAPLLALMARSGEALGTFCLEDGERFHVSDTTVEEGAPLQGKTLDFVLERHEVLILACGKDGQWFFLHDVKLDAVLGAGDRLVVCGPTEAMRSLLAQAQKEKPPELLWAGWLRRQGRMVWRTLGEIDLPVKIVASVFFSVIILSTLVFHLSMERDGIPDALYRTISLMATGSDMGGGLLPEGAWQKVFISLLRIVGAALTAAFTAILTNYLIRARLGSAFEVRRIPEGGHVVVCGLGNVGVRVVEELLREGEKVVVLERRQDSPFIPAARRQGAAVIVGDATVPEILKQAHAAQARAVVAVTSNELVNLEVVLLARAMNPQQRVVLRLIDQRLAALMRDSANVKRALSVPALAAPAFVATLFGDRVRTMFLVEERLFAVVDLTVAAGDGFLENQSVRTLAVDYHLLPLVLRTEQGEKKLRPFNRRLAPGDCLTVVMALSELQRLLQREASRPSWSVFVTACPLPARPWLSQMFRTIRQIPPEEAESAMDRLPVCLQSPLTRGQAEDLLYRLSRERISAELRPAESDR